MTMGGHSDLSLQQARRIAVAAQGLSGTRSPARSGRAKILQVYQQIAQTQIDSVNVVARAHYQPVFARLGDYSRTQLDRLVAGAASPVTEYWSHEASYVRSDLVGDLRRWRPRHWADASHRFTPEQHQLVAPVLEFLDSNPGSSARQISQALDIPATTDKDHWGWNWNDTKLVTESLFWQTRILSLGRNQHFERRFAPASTVIQAQSLEPAHSAQESLRRLVLAAVDALGVASLHCVSEYFRLPAAPVKTMVHELLHAGELQRCRVESLTEDFYLRPGLVIASRRSRTTRILSPFDSMIFNRRRLQKLFGFHYRIEIYVPEPKRRYGYYVFPILHGDDLVGRVDLKADRKLGELQVKSVHFEAAPTESVLQGTDAELWLMARWLGLSSVTVGTERVLCSPWRLSAKHQASV